MSLKKKKLLLNLLLLIPVAVVVVSLVLQNRLIAGVGLVIVIGYGVLYTSLWRCPYCGEYLGRKTEYKCPNCQKKLEL